MDPRVRLRARRVRRHRRVRARIRGTAERPRLAVFRSVKHIAAQVIDDDTGRTLLSAYERELPDSDRRKPKGERAVLLGALLAEKAKAKGIRALVVDRGTSRYHGRVKALAEALRTAGLTP